MTIKRPIHEVFFYGHLYTRWTSPWFDASKTDRTWFLWTSRVEGQYLMKFSAIISRTHPISTTPLPVWVRVRVTSRISNTRTFMSFFDQTAKPWNPTRFPFNHLSLDYDIPLSQQTLSTFFSITYGEPCVATCVVVTAKRTSYEDIKTV